MVKHDENRFLFIDSCEKNINGLWVLIDYEWTSCQGTLLRITWKHDNSSNSETRPKDPEIFLKTVFFGRHLPEWSQCGSSFGNEFNFNHLWKCKYHFVSFDYSIVASVLCWLIFSQNDRSRNNTSNPNNLLLPHYHIICFHFPNSINQYDWVCSYWLSKLRYNFWGFIWKSFANLKLLKLEWRV